jgi:hypothetical protein
VKFLVPCQDKITPGSTTTDPWLTVSKLLAYTHGAAGVLQGIYDKHKEVVVKFGDAKDIQYEYDAAEKLHNAFMVGFIKFMCVFACNDEFTRILKQNYSNRPYLCNGPGNSIGCIVMPYYPLGSMDKYCWKKHQIQEFKNILKQVCFALCNAFHTLAFVHVDLHAGNVLLRNTTKTILQYQEGVKLQLYGKYAIIMDLQDCQVHNPEMFITSIERIIYTCCSANGSDLQFNFDTRTIRIWWDKNDHKITQKSYRDLSDIIDNISLRYVKSEIPKSPFI